MALRVLLADESTSIKKVMQLALQDFGVEVKSVPIGLDVLPVAKSWSPDIIFVDVLLSKKSGYDVCADIKSDPQTAKTPVVLIWSGFMDLDEKKASSSGASLRLEKPFDAKTLREIVRSLVPPTRDNAISEYLSFPERPDFLERPPESSTVIPLPPGKWPSNGSFNKLEKFKINLPEEDFQDDFPGDFAQPHRPPMTWGNPETTSTTTPPTRAEAEQILQEQSRLVLKDIAWKIMPDMIERLVKEEIQKLLKEAERL